MSDGTQHALQLRLGAFARYFCDQANYAWHIRGPFVPQCPGISECRISTAHAVDGSNVNLKAGGEPRWRCADKARQRRAVSRLLRGRLIDRFAKGVSNVCPSG